ncbi:winged helix DNA-binding protein [Undibacterium sp. TJN19]|uniref:winged helix DNA-binding protein n=1 Tax=Undibacterium sp. TJN19 TaxID=3413055 RepID=UPI003BF211ED
MPNAKPAKKTSLNAGDTTVSVSPVATAASAATTPAPRRPIVSSAHLAQGRSSELSEFEFGMIIASNAFNRWAVRCMAAVGMKDMTITDVLVLHHINHRAREKKLADIAFILNIEDTHIVNYSLKKLQALALVQTEKRGKEILYSTNEAGRDICQRYSEVREQVLVSALTGDGTESFELSELARFLRVLSGLYEQAARAATSL